MPQRDAAPFEPDERVEEPLVWDAATSFVVSGPLGTRGRWPGRRFGTRREARSYYRSMHGRILDEVRSAPDRYIFRVPRPQASVPGALKELA